MKFINLFKYQFFFKNIKSGEIFFHWYPEEMFNLREKRIIIDNMFTEYDNADGEILEYIKSDVK